MIIPRARPSGPRSRPSSVLAREAGKPAVIHAREADDDVAAMLRGHPDVSAILHSFSSGPGLLRAGLDLRHYVSFSGMVTFKNWRLDHAILDTPLDRILRGDRRAVPGAGAPSRQAERAGVRALHGRADRRGARDPRRGADRRHRRQRGARLSPVNPLARGSYPGDERSVRHRDRAGRQAPSHSGRRGGARARRRTTSCPTGGTRPRSAPTRRARDKPTGRLVLVTGINPTPAGEGKSTVTVGVSQALRRLGKKVVVSIREPSLGPVFGVKGGAAGGGYAQVVPMDEINLHFTGDFHAITSAHNLLSAMLDNHLHQGNALNIDPRRITWPRTIDMNDRALRSIVISLGGINAGPVREDRFVIVPGSEIMAILALASDLGRSRGRASAGSSSGLTRDRKPVTAGELKAAGAMTLLLKDAILPNLVQTLEGGPALVHAGPFGNIAHGCNSLVATRLGALLGDIVLTEAGFGADLGAEKFFDIKCRFGGLKPEAAVVVATVRALKCTAASRRTRSARRDVAALKRGMVNLEAHVRNVQKFGVPVVVALNRFTSDTERSESSPSPAAKGWGARAALSDVWAKGGEGGEAVAREVLAVLDEGKADFKPIYDAAPADQGQDRDHRAGDLRRGRRGLQRRGREEHRAVRGDGPRRDAGLHGQAEYSFSDDATKLGRPTGFRITIRDVSPSAGAGFVVALRARS